MCRFRRGLRWVLCAAVFFSWVAPAWSQSDESTPEEMFHRRIHVNEEVQPLGENPFGEQVSLQNGELSFEQTDITLHGTGPDIVIARSFSPGWRTSTSTPEDAPFADWQLNLPRLTSMVDGIYNTSGPYPGAQGNWVVPTGTNRCTAMGNGPALVSGNSGGIPQMNWWHGYQLIMPGQGSQSLLARWNSQLSPSMSDASGNLIRFNTFTASQWMVGCLPQTASGESGEAFFVVSPDGTKYWLDWFTYEWGNTLSSPPFSGHTVSAAASVTRVEDRFGNWVQYRYTGPMLTSITASDGRSVSIAWRTDARYIDHISVTTSTAGTRTWTYQYANIAPLQSGTSLNLGYTGSLSAVLLPDGSSWQFNLGNLLSSTVGADMVDGVPYCVRGYFHALNQGTTFTGSITHPSGLTGTFGITPTMHTRVGAIRPGTCGTTKVPFFIPSAYFSNALVSKNFSGAGVNETWTYAYNSPPIYWADQCPNGVCPVHTVTTDVTDPLGNVTRYSFDNTLNSFMESKLVATYYGFNTSNSSALRTELKNYADPTTGGPFNNPIGSVMDLLVNTDQQNNLAPVNQITTLQDGDTYTWQALGFNAFAQAIQVNRSSNIAGQTSVTHGMSYLNDLPHWVLGLPQEVDNLTTNETESLSTYNLSNVTLQSRARFGQTLMSYTFDGQGQLASFTDGRSNTTTLSNYKLGIPQAIGYADKTTQSLVVDDFGQISSLTDQAGNTTSYSYDPIGRITGITYPAGDEVAWSPKTFSYNFVTGAERGIAAGHWRRTTTKGNALTTTYFDAMLRPVLSDTGINGTANADISTRTDYDWKGQKTFVSYPVSGTPDLSAISSGSSSIYDALGRLTQTQQASELGTLTTTTAYLSGARQQVTDPKGYVTTSSYQVFDQPSYNAVIQVQAPEGITQAITRDVYGNPLAIAQSGLYGTQSVAVTKTLTYDSYHRLCRTTEPESGSEVTAYDGANNVAWTAAGLSITGTGCGQEQVADAAKIQRIYDAMNRVQTLTPPAGTQSTGYTYDPLGNLATSTSGISTSAITRNKLGLPTVETLSVNGNGANVLRYGHDSNGNLSTLSYPDGTVINYAPDALGRPTQVGSYASGISYFPDGDVQHFTYGNGTDYLVQKNARQLLSNFTYAKGSTLNLSEDFAYDGNGNITTINDLAGGPRSKVLSYDTLNRLTQAQANGMWGVETYGYDPLNNIRSRVSGGQSFTYNYDTTNRLGSITNGATTTSSYSYDNRGNVTTKNGNTLIFDAKNQLTQIPGFDSYAYDAAGRRVLKTPASGNSSTYYFYNQAGQLLYQFDGATTKTTDYIYLGKKMIARSEGYATNVVGGIDGINVGSQGNGFVSGWACSSGLAQSINVDLYVGGPVGTGTLIGRYSASQASEAGVLSACGVTTGSYRFYIALTAATQSQYAGQGVYVYGISPVGNSNVLLTNSGKYVVPAAPSSPAAPTTTSATVASDLSNISVSWSASTGAISYTVQQQFNGGAWTALVNGNTTSTTISNPADGSYVFQAQACNANGCSVWTASSAVTVAHIPPTPASISVPATSNGPIAISWAASPTATYYHLYQSFNGGTWAQVYDGAAINTTITVTASGNYNFFIAAGNANGWSGQLASSSTVVVTIPPASAPSLTVPASSNTGSYSVSWGSVSGATSYTLQEQVNGGGWSTVQASNANSWSASGRGNGTYGYQVQACNAGGCGSWSAVGSISVLLAPPVPTGVRIAEAGNIHVTTWSGVWNAVSGATSYNVKRNDTNAVLYSGSATTVNLGSGSTPYNLPYSSISVQACNASACSAWTPSG